MTKKSRKRRGGDIRTPDPITKQMLNDAIKKNAKKMLNVFHKVEKMKSTGDFVFDQIQPKNEKTNIPFDSMSSGDVNT